MEADGARIYIIDETAADDSRAERLIRLARLYAAEEAMPLPQTLCIAKGEYGKPYFENAPWLHFPCPIRAGFGYAHCAAVMWA